MGQKGGGWGKKKHGDNPSARLVLGGSLKVSQEVTGPTATGIQEEETEECRRLGKLGKKRERLHPKRQRKHGEQTGGCHTPARPPLYTPS